MYVVEGKTNEAPVEGVERHDKHVLTSGIGSKVGNVVDANGEARYDERNSNHRKSEIVFFEQLLKPFIG